MKLTLDEANLLMKNNNGILDLSSTEIKEIPKSVDVGNIIGFLQYGCK